MSKPEYWQYRLDCWNQFKAKREAERSSLPDEKIVVTLPDGSTKDGIKFKTTPHDIALSISKGLAKAVVVSKVNDQMWDLSRPLEDNCSLVLYKIDSPEANHVFWHSSSHVLGQSLEYNFNCLLTKGPATEKGFFYDFLIPGDRKVSQDDYSAIETFVKTIIDEAQPFERLTLTKEEALDMFKYNKYKTELIKDKIQDNGTTSVYKCGPLIDLCKGPHIPNTSLIKGFKVYNNSSSYWKNNSENDSLQRVYGISFPTAKQLTEWTKLMEELEKRDHRNIGKDQELFFFHNLSPGSCFFLPRGAHIYNKLIEYTRVNYKKRGFTEVISPNVYNKDLWETSGHWDLYKDNMFCFECDKQVWALKPMNCPGHCLIFKSRNRSYRDLPLRYAEFGVLHRNEAHGSLTGLTRVRRFQQDDAHIFCTPDQIEQEITNNLEFLRDVYGVFGFQFTLNLSTRPKDKFLGTVEMWDNAESQLKKVLENFGSKWEIKEGDGAFYGPKIDITVHDAMGRSHQCATVQLDFNLPIRFELEYDTEKEGEKGRPVIVHRAIYGSLERFIAILCEHTAGKWPFWLSPRQVMICSIAPAFEKYCNTVKQKLQEAGFEAEVDSGDRTIMKKVRQYQLAQYNYILVVGKEEEEQGTVNVRIRDEKKERGTISVEKLIEEFKENVNNFK